MPINTPEKPQTNKPKNPPPKLPQTPCLQADLKALVRE